jgi:phospholipid/cholesterol/gamma-HCH transport system permease protein
MRVGTLVAEAMCREVGPIMTGLILAASVGSSMAAQLGTMAVSEEIEALEVMSINPVRFLVMPRLVAMMFTCPALTVYSNVIGIIGGGMVADTQLNVSWGIYYDNVLFMLESKEIWMGILKAWVFGCLIVSISCYQGLIATRGAVGVGMATRGSVVISFLMILVSGYFLTRLFY